MLPSRISSCPNSQAAAATIIAITTTVEVALATVVAAGAVLVEQVVCRESLLAIATRLRPTSN